jgi:hypothetical protein
VNRGRALVATAVCGPGTELLGPRKAFAVRFLNLCGLVFEASGSLDGPSGPPTESLEWVCGSVGEPIDYKRIKRLGLWIKD